MQRRRPTPASAGPAFTTASEDANATAVRGARTPAFMVNWPFVWARALDAVEAGTLEPVGARRLRLGALPAGRRGQAEPRRRYGGINLGVGAFSQHVDLAYEAAECIVSEENQAYYFDHQRQPGRRRPSVYDDPEVLEEFPHGPGHPGVPRAGRTPAADRRTTARSPGHSSASTTRRRRSTRRPTGTDADELITRRPGRGAAAVSTTTLPPTARRPQPVSAPTAAGSPTGARRAQARLDAGRPGLLRHAAGHRLPDPAGGLRLAVLLPAHRPGEPGVHRAEQLRGHPHRPAVVAGDLASRCSSPSSPSPSSSSSASRSPWSWPRR